MSTKERILDSALTLFAEKGYDGTGVDLIAENAGIKGPSLYRHYKSKEEVLNEIIDIAEERYNDCFGSDDFFGSIPKSRKEFIRKAMEKLEFTMTDPMIKTIRIFLVQEQFRNERLAEITTRHQLDDIVEMYEKVISGMMDEGLIKKDDPYSLSLELTAPVVLLIAKADRLPGCEEEVLKKIEKHIQHFCDVYMI